MAANEFKLITRTMLDPQNQMVRFFAVLQEGETIMTKLSQMLAVQNPEVGGEVEKFQNFVTKVVPTGKTLHMSVVINCNFIEPQV